MVYAAASRALAPLEVSVHLDLNEDLPTDRYYLELDIPDDLEVLELEIPDLPYHWDNKPPILRTQLIGDTFVRSNFYAVLRVPSSIVPPEYNFLINPRHEDAHRIQVVSTEPMTFDTRMVKK